MVWVLGVALLVASCIAIGERLKFVGARDELADLKYRYKRQTQELSAARVQLLNQASVQDLEIRRLQSAILSARAHLTCIPDIRTFADLNGDHHATEAKAEAV